MEDQLVQVLANTQLAAEAPRKQAELDLKQARLNPAYPLSLANIGKHSSISIEIRQAALSALRLFIENNWSGENDEGNVIPISDAAKEQIRPILLELALSADQERKIKTAARYVTVGSARSAWLLRASLETAPRLGLAPRTCAAVGPVTNRLFLQFCCWSDRQRRLPRALACAAAHPARHYCHRNRWPATWRPQSPQRPR